MFLDAPRPFSESGWAVLSLVTSRGNIFLDLHFADVELAEAVITMEEETRKAADYFKSAKSIRIIKIVPRKDLLRGLLHPEPGSQICERRFNRVECERLKKMMERAVYGHLLNGVALVTGKFRENREPLNGDAKPIAAYTDDEITNGLRQGWLVTELAVSNHRTYALAQLNDENEAFNADSANSVLPKKSLYSMQYLFVEGVPLSLLSAFSASTNSVSESKV